MRCIGRLVSVGWRSMVRKRGLPPSAPNRAGAPPSHSNPRHVHTRRVDHSGGFIHRGGAIPASETPSSSSVRWIRPSLLEVSEVGHELLEFAGMGDVLVLLL